MALWIKMTASISSKLTEGFRRLRNALEFAKIPDSNYFKSVEATVNEVIDGLITRTWDLTDTIIPKDDDGVFFGETQKVYTFNTIGAPLNPDATYKLEIDINEGTLNVAGETRLVNGVALSTNFTSIQNQMSFYDDGANGGYESRKYQFFCRHLFESQLYNGNYYCRIH